MTDCSNFLATSAEQPFNMRRIAEIGLQSPEYGKHFLVLVIVPPGGGTLNVEVIGILVGNFFGEP